MSAKHRHRTPPDPKVRAEVSAVADTGAQSDLWSLAEYLSHGFSRDSLFRVKLGMSAGNRSPIPIEGAFFAKISTQTSSGKVTECRSMIYVSNAVQSMYLLYETMLDLDLLAADFPAGGDVARTGATTVGPAECGVGEGGSGNRGVTSTSPASAALVINGGCDAADTANDTPCSCPQRTSVPPRPTSLPFACTPHNN